ncbi:hypothetical protein [Devriesea agamarum]|uniref:hypothetical protein n=1 Tax=Devriesea agamarum TaxID=472569 RepID=UPI00071CBC0F|nr:hypothetical protein [Devriesea agamarum]
MTNPYARKPKRPRPTPVAQTFRRPENLESPPRKNTSVWLDVELHRHAKMLAVQRGISISDLVNEGLRLALATYENTTI